MKAIFLALWLTLISGAGLFGLDQASTAIKFIGLSRPAPSPGSLFQVVLITNASVQKATATLSSISGQGRLEISPHLRSLGEYRLWLFNGVCPADNLSLNWRLQCSVESNQGWETREIELNLADHAFYAESIQFDSVMSNLKTIPDPQKERESAQLSALLLSFKNLGQNGDLNFCEPVQTTRKTAFFGDRRIYIYQNGRSEKTQHNGIDFGGDKLPIQTCANGQVLMATKRIVTGNTIVIQHAPGLFSLYYHLSNMVVAPGDLVRAGQSIGLTGATGLVTGPHLHWELRCQGIAVNPESLIQYGYIDRGELSSLLSLPLRP